MTEYVNPIEFESRALEYLSTGKGGEGEVDWLATALHKQSVLYRALARAYAEATNNAVGGTDIKRVLARMQLVIAKQVGIPEEYLHARLKDEASPPPH